MNEMSDRIPVRLLSYYGGVNKGEIAGYVPEIAARLIEQGIAEAYVDEEGAAEPEVPVTAAKPGKVTAASLPAQGADA
jgi:hypothetical protein